MAVLQQAELAGRGRDATTLADTSPTIVLSVVMPVFNEAATIDRMIARVRMSPISHELVIVDDGSNDGTGELLARCVDLAGVRVLRRETNGGKGAALKLGFSQARGQIVLIQDADLEYDPADYPLLIEPILSGEADVVYGSRFLSGRIRSTSLTSYWANRIITALFNRVTGQHLTDVETCYKALRRDVLRQVGPLLEENRFGIEIELAARIAKLPGVRIAERPIHYQPRTRREGKKIGWADGVKALWCVLRFG